MTTETEIPVLEALPTQRQQLDRTVRRAERQ